MGAHGALNGPAKSGVRCLAPMSLARMSWATDTRRQCRFTSILERQCESYLVEIPKFIDCIRRNAQPLITGTDGRILVVMALAARRSYEQNRSVALIETARARAKPSARWRRMRGF